MVLIISFDLSSSVAIGRCIYLRRYGHDLRRLFQLCSSSKTSINASTQMFTCIDTNVHLHRLSIYGVYRSIACMNRLRLCRFQILSYPLPTTRRCYNFHCCCSSLHLFHLGSRSGSAFSLCHRIYRRHVYAMHWRLLHRGRSNEQLFICGASSP